MRQVPRGITSVPPVPAPQTVSTARLIAAVSSVTPSHLAPKFLRLGSSDSFASTSLILPPSCPAAEGAPPFFAASFGLALKLNACDRAPATQATAAAVTISTPLECIVRFLTAVPLWQVDPIRSCATSRSQREKDAQL